MLTVTFCFSSVDVQNQKRAVLLVSRQDIRLSVMGRRIPCSSPHSERCVKYISPEIGLSSASGLRYTLKR